MRKLWIKFITTIGKIQWEGLKKLLTGKTFNLTKDDHRKILQVLSEGNYIILTKRTSHLSTYLVRLSHFFLTGRWGYWSHVCMNIEGPIVNMHNSVRILESVGIGVKTSSFDEAFNCDSVCILRPKIPRIIKIDWETLVEKSLKNIGKEYDNLFKLGDDKEMSCVEVILDALETIPDYQILFHGLLAMIKIEHNLTPDMYYECGSFEVVLEIRR